MLTPFRGKCPFRMYIPNKSAKYCINLFIVNDADFQYLLDSYPYLGKANSPVLGSGENQGEFFTMKLMEANLIKAGRTICCDNWFTLLHLAQTLQNCNIHCVDIIRVTSHNGLQRGSSGPLSFPRLSQ